MVPRFPGSLIPSTPIVIGSDSIFWGSGKTNTPNAWLGVLNFVITKFSNLCEFKDIEPISYLKTQPS